MLKTTTYLTTQSHSVVYTTIGSTPNRNMTMYARNLKVYKGAKNPIVIEMKNNDQKAVDITGKTFVFNILDQEERQTLVSKGGTITSALKGRVQFDITESDLQKVSGSFLNYSILDNTSGERGVIYVDDQFGAMGNIEVVDGPYTEFRESQSITLPDINPVAVQAYPHLNENAALHTCQVYFTNFTGTLKIEGSMAAISELDGDEWFDITTKTYTDQADNVYINFTGVYSHVRFSRTITSGTIDKILYRL